MNWRHQVDLSDLWNAYGDTMTLQEVAGEVAKRCRALPYQDDTFIEIMEEMEDLSRNPQAEGDWFDEIMDALWTYGDHNRIWFGVI